VLGKGIENFIVFYVDDLLLFSPTFEKYLRRIDIVIGKLTNASFTLNAAKCPVLSNRGQIPIAHDKLVGCVCRLGSSGCHSEIPGASECKIITTVFGNMQFP
jgi:hypothetical protein